MMSEKQAIKKQTAGKQENENPVKDIIEAHLAKKPTVKPTQVVLKQKKRGFDPDIWSEAMDLLARGVTLTELRKRGFPTPSTFSKWMQNEEGLKPEYNMSMEAGCIARADECKMKAIDALEDRTLAPDGGHVSVQERDMLARNWTRLAHLEAANLAARKRVESAPAVATVITLNLGGQGG